jgi:tetratricopeptide (TPR) repeat protein
MFRRGTAAATVCTSSIAAAFLLAVTVGAQSRVVELNEAGWKALRAGYTDRAASLFAEALKMRPDDPVLLLGSGAAANAQGKQKEAIAQLQRALELNPRLTPASRLLGQIAYAEGDVDLALKTYENALKYAPGDPALSRELEEWRRETDVHRSFDERRYDQFRVLFEGREEKQLARQATEIFHLAFRRICTRLGEFPTATIVAVLYTEQEFRDITRAPGWSSGQYDGRNRVPVAGAEQHPELFERVLTHELTHAILADIAPRGIPVWLNEGLAQYFEGASPDAARKRMKALGSSIPLKNLEGSFARLGSRVAVQAAYDESLLAVSVILDKPGFIWIRLLHEFEQNRSAEATIASFGWSYADLEAPFAR